MGDIHDFLRRGMHGFDPSPEEGLERTLARARQRHRWRQGLAFLAAAGLFGATIAGAAILQGTRGVPLAGPTPSPSASSGVVVTEEGTWLCRPAFRNQGRICLARTGEVIEVASGVHAGLRWTVRGFTAMYDGPDFSLSYERMAGSQVRHPMVCMRWKGEGNPSPPFCQTAEPAGGVFGVEMPPSLMTLPIARPAEVSERGPLTGLEESGGGFVGNEEGTWTAMLAWTPEGTARVEISADGRALGPAVLAGPFEELRTAVKWFVAFFPKESREVTYTAYDAVGSVLWRETDRYPSPREARRDPPLLRRLPEDRAVVASRTDAGTGWDVFTYQTTKGPVFGYALDSGEWSYTEDPEALLDPCTIRSNSIHWIYLRQSPERISVLQFAPVSPEVARVTFVLNDGRSVEARVVPVDAIPWKMFTVVFEGPPETRVADIILEASDGTRLNDPARC